MKPNELMIGDWVEYGQYITTVRNLSDKIVLSGCVGRLDEVRPVPLTEKILENNGATRYGAKYANLQQWVLKFGDKRKTIMQDVLHEEWCANDVWFKYVHELQHILRLIGINDLADNFKVKGGAK